MLHGELVGSGRLPHQLCHASLLGLSNGCIDRSAGLLSGRRALLEWYVIHSTPVFQVAGVMYHHEATMLSVGSHSITRPLHPVVSCLQ